MGTATDFTLEKDKRNGLQGKLFFRPEPTLWDCFVAFLPPDFIDKTVDWTSIKTETIYTRADILGVFAICFIYGLVTLPSIGTLHALGLPQVLNLIGIEQPHVSHPPKEFNYNTLLSMLQYNLPARKEDRKDEQDEMDLFYLIEENLLIWLLGVPVL